MIALVSDAQFGLDDEQYAYARQLAYEAANGAWAGTAAIIKTSASYLEGGMSLTDQRALLTELLRLAAEDHSHAWEAPILTGYPSAFAAKALEKINETHA